MTDLITLWDYWVVDEHGQRWEFNHIEDGWTPNSMPTPKTEGHKKQWKGKWWKHEGYLVGDREPRKALTRPEYIRLLVGRN